MEKANITRINELARLAKQRALTPEEEAERARLRKNYLAAFRSSFQNQLDHTVIQREDGSKEPLRRRGK